MTDTGLKIDLPSFLQGENPVVEATRDVMPTLQLAPVKSRSEKLADAIRKRAEKTREVHHEHTNTVETTEVIPPGMVERIEALEARLQSLMENANARDNLSDALHGLLAASQALGTMNDGNADEIRKINITLDRLEPMVHELNEWIGALPSRKTA